ncbi:MAG TPA: CBS domain-containing protein [Desulfosporosinus sp.]|nr:CBS domain-containing protein [Desulfosporosinus sp.]
MPGTKKVNTLMVPVSEYPVVYDTDTLKDAINALKNYIGENKEHRSMIVLTREGTKEKLAGILTVRDILNAIKAKNMSYDGAEAFNMSWSRFYHKSSLCISCTTKVADAIRPLVTDFVQSEQDVSDAIGIMMTKKINILPVFEGEKLVGIIRAIDVLDYIGELL